MPALPDGAIPPATAEKRRPVRRAHGVLISHFTEVHDRRRTNFVTSPNGQAFQVSEEELFLLLALDGHTPYREIEAEFNARFRSRLRWETFERYLHQLLDLGLVEFVDEAALHDAGGAGASETRHRGLDDYTPHDEERFERIPFGFTFMNPMPMFRVLVWLFRPFMPYLVWLLGPLAWFAGLIMYKHQTDLVNDMATLQNMTNLYVAIVVAWLVDNLMARITQGAVAAGFGADIDGLGFSMFLGVLPRFFIEDVPIKRLTKRQMLWCYVTPVLYRLFLMAIGAVIWILCRKSGSPFAWFGLMCLELGAFAVALCIWPVIPGDAYRLMFVYLEQPLLRRRALSLVKLKFTFRGAPAGLSTADRWGLFIIGVLTILTSGAMIGAGLLWFFYNMTSAHQGTGLALWTFLCCSSAAWGLLALYYAKYLYTKTNVPARRTGAQPATDVGSMLPVSSLLPRRS